jgi:hypothetical protein
LKHAAVRAARYAEQPTQWNLSHLPALPASYG